MDYVYDICEKLEKYMNTQYFTDSAFLHGLAACLNDYQYLNSLDAVKHVLEVSSNLLSFRVFYLASNRILNAFLLQGLPSNLNSLRDVEFDNLIKNLSDYISSIPQESTSSGQWQQIINTFGTFCGKLQNILPQRSRVRCHFVIYSMNLYMPFIGSVG